MLRWIGILLILISIALFWGLLSSMSKRKNQNAGFLTNLFSGCAVEIIVGTIIFCIFALGMFLFFGDY
ncbi:hypothetical protein [Brevibacillus formosus]|uniref:hypothetical protein n=1 Tax=Brevibacillus formosus TaxID=54913 RepID=UPI003F197E0F